MTAEPMSGAQMEELDLFYEEVRQAHSHPLWLLGDENLTTEPKPKTVAFLLWPSCGNGRSFGL